MSSCLFSQGTLRLQKGTVTDSLYLPDVPGSLYSIYLPKSFDFDKKWPVLFGFNSKGNSKKLTKVFRKTAEELGYIIVVADFSEKTKSNKVKTTFISLFMTHIFSLFPIHKRRVYVFGIDDDALLNSILPVVYNEFNGVIAINNSYHYYEFTKLRKDFSYAGVIGNRNFRYQDFINIKKHLNGKAIDARLYVYDGNEEFPSESTLTKVLISFTLQDMLKGKIEMDSGWVKSQLEKDQIAVDQLIKEKAFFKAYNELKAMRNRYHLFFDINELKEQQKKIRRTGDYRKEKRLKARSDNKEIFLRELVRLSLNEDVTLLQYKNLGWWEYKVSEFNKIADSSEKYSRNMGIRMNEFLKELIFYYKTENVPEVHKKDESKIFLNMLSTIVDPKDYEAYRNIISLCTIDQDIQASLYYLEKLLQNGYKDLDSLYTIEGTLTLKISKEYNALIKKYLGTSKYYAFFD